MLQKYSMGGPGLGHAAFAGSVCCTLNYLFHPGSGTEGKPISSNNGHAVSFAACPPSSQVMHLACNYCTFSPVLGFRKSVPLFRIFEKLNI